MFFFATTLTLLALTALSGCGSGHSSEVTAPVASAGGPYSGTANQPITFDGSKSTGPAGQALTYAWNFGDGTTGSGVAPSHSYAAPGSYTVTLTVTDTSGGTGSATSTATIVGAPVASAGGPYSGTANQPIAFDGSKSTGPSGQTLTYAWNFGDGTTASGVAPSHSYAAPGSYTVTLTVTDTSGGTSTATSTATIVGAPVASAGGPYSGAANQPIAFDGSKSTGPSGQTLTYAWNFGDGTTASGVAPSHNYAAPGSYTVTLTVTDTSGGTSTATSTATIVGAPVASAGGPYSGTANQPITFDGSKSTGPAGQTLTYAWNFGDGTTGSGVAPSHSYSAPGSYTVTLTATDTSGGTSSATTTATIGSALVANPGGPYTGTVNHAVPFNGSRSTGPSGQTLTYAWNFGDGSMGTGISLTHNYNATGTYEVSLTITDTGGATSTATTTATIALSSSFTLGVTPGTAKLLPAQSIAFAVTLSSPDGFSGLASLAVSGLPSGVTASFEPASVAAGQVSTLTLSAPATQATSTSTLSLTASASINGQPVTQSATAALQVSAISTSFLGRTVVDNAQQTPLAGVTVKFLGVDDKGNRTGCSGQTASDGGGNFLLSNLPTACIGPQLIAYDGTTASSPPGKYAGVSLSYTLVSGQVVTSPVLVHLPRIDTAESVQVQQNAPDDQLFTFSSIPGLQVTVYAGTTFTLEDGTQPNPFPLVAIEIPIDRLPDSIPTSGMLTPFIVAFQPANAFSSQPVAVDFPNPLNVPPGTAATFTTLDPTHGYMVPYGTGTVSPDGTTFVADADPAHSGHRYGLVHFDWHGPALPPPSAINPAPPLMVCPLTCRPSTTPFGSSPSVGKPVDLSSGLEVLTSTDIAIDGGRGGIQIVRTYRNFSYIAGPFGLGTNINYGYQLDTSSITSGLPTIGLVAPDGGEYNLPSQGGGTWSNSSVSFLVGAVMTNPSGGVYDLRWKDGTVWQFQSPSSSGREAFLTSITDPNGNVITIAVSQVTSSAGVVGTQITRVTDPVGRSLVLNYNSDNLITSITDPTGRQVRYTYNTFNQIETFTDVNGGVTTYGYKSTSAIALRNFANGTAAAGIEIQDLSQVTDPRGVVIAQNTYDPNHRVVKQVEGDGGVYSFAYTLQNSMVGTSPVLQTAVTDPLNNVTVYRFDPDQTLTSVTDPSGQTTTFGRTSGGMVSSVSGNAICAVCGNPSGGDRTFSYDASGNLLSETDALGNTTSYTYDPTFNVVTSVTDPLGHVANFKYDSKGNLASQQDPNGNTTAYTRNNYGQITQITNALNQATTLAYDGFGNLASITNPLNNATMMEYDFLSRPAKITDALQRSSSASYDAFGRVVRQTNAQGNTTTFSYDADGNLTSVVDAKAHKPALPMMR